MDTLAILLAAGIGERMKSKTHKVLHPILGLPMIEYIVRAVRDAGIARTIAVVGDRAQQVKDYLGDRVFFAIQDPSKGWGTAKAAQAAFDAVGSGPVFILLGDSPLIRAETLVNMRKAVEGGACAAVMTAVVDDPTGYGRILRDEAGNVCAIVEHKDATDAQRAIKEINSAALCVDGAALKEALPQIGNNNAKREYYLTDLIDILYRAGKRIATVRADEEEGVGINDRAQLARATALMRDRINAFHMQNGVTLLDPSHCDISPDVAIGADTVIHPGCSLMGKTTVGGECTLMPNSRLEDSTVGDRTRIDNSVLTRCTVGEGVAIGPFAHLRPDTTVGKHCRIGNFVELKNSVIGDKTRISHLTYVGDADVGEDINLGCGVVFSNYDGKKKHRCKVGDHAFSGCNVNLVAPVSVGERAYIAAGTTVTEDVPAGALAVGRAQPYIKEGWVEKRMSEGKL